MAVAWIVAVTLLAFGALLVGMMVVLLRASDKRAVVRERAILTALEQIRTSIEQIEAVAREQPGDPMPAPAAVDIGGEVVPLDAETIARLNAVADKVNASGGIGALRAALAQGLALAERGLAEEGKSEEGKGEEQGTAEDMTGRVIPLRRQRKPPGDEGGGV
jgi:hypothetical protein